MYYLGSGTMDTVWLGPVLLVPGSLQLSSSDTLCPTWFAVVAYASHLTLTDTRLTNSVYNTPPVAFDYGSYPTGEYFSC